MMNMLVRAVLLTVLVASFAPAIAVGQTPTTDSLMRRTNTLEHQVADLERRVRALEVIITAEPSRARPVPADRKWRDLSNWRQLRRGMKMDEVRALLGEPEKVVAKSLFTSWYWDYPNGAEVQFDGESNKLEEWSEPSP